MNIKSFYLTLPALPILAGLCVSATSSSASPLVSIGDNADLYFNGSSSLRWTSNVFRDEDDEDEDLIWTLSPGFELNVGRGLSNADLSVTTRYDILRYNDNSQLDTELFHIKADGSYQTSRLDLSGSVYFDENQSTSGDENLPDGFDDLIEFDTYGARVDGEYRYSPKFSVGSGVHYYEKEYQSYEDRFSDREYLTVPLDLFYELTPKVDLSIGYSYTNTDVEETQVPTFGGLATRRSGYDRDSHFFNVGARGNLLPKLTGFFKIGYRTTSSDNSDIQTVDDSTGAPVGPSTRTDRDDDGMLGLDADFTWAATPKLTARLALSRDYGVGGEGQSTENSTANFSASYSISTNYSAYGDFGYTLREYTETGRDDNQYSAGFGLNYTPNQYWRFGAGYNYSENDSDVDSRSYEVHSLNVSATLRY